MQLFIIKIISNLCLKIKNITFINYASNLKTIKIKVRVEVIKTKNEHTEENINKVRRGLLSNLIKFIISWT